jgi:hypothetical protein
MAVDRRDCKMLAGCFTESVHADYSENGLPAADFARDELIRIIRDAIGGFTATQHLSTNHLIEFDTADPDRATCDSSMYAQHYLDSASEGEVFTLHGSYLNYMVRTPDGWRIERLVQHISWCETRRGIG